MTRWSDFRCYFPFDHATRRGFLGGDEVPDGVEHMRLRVDEFDATAIERNAGAEVAYLAVHDPPLENDRGAVQHQPEVVQRVIAQRVCGFDTRASLGDVEDGHWVEHGRFATGSSGDRDAIETAFIRHTGSPFLIAPATDRSSRCSRMR